MPIASRAQPWQRSNRSASVTFLYFLLRGNVVVSQDAASVPSVQLPPPLRKTLDGTMARAPSSALHRNWMSNTICSNGPNRTQADTAAGASSPDEHTYLGVRSARRNLTLDRHLRETRGGKSLTQDKGSTSCTHAHTHLVPSKVHHCNQISNSIRSHQIQLNSIKVTRPLATPHGMGDKEYIKLAWRVGTSFY